MKRIVQLITLILVINFIPFVKANNISSVSMDVYIDDNGDAHITEVWNAKLSSGTEGYKPYYNLGKSKIKDFTVLMDDKAFTSLSSWNTSASFDAKAYKNGLHSITDGVELCFGISSYGKHNYVLSYTITNFVYQLKDSQMTYFSLMPYDFSSAPDNVYIKIHSSFNYSDTLDVWGYGYDGYAYVYDGYIEMSTKNGLDSDEYMVILIKFPNGTFQNLESLDKDFDYYYEMAEEGAIHHSGDDTPWFAILFSLLIQILVWVIIISAILNSSKGTSNQKYRLNFGKEGKNLKDVPNFRDIPCNKDIFRAYYLAYNFNLMKKQTDLLGAVLLKWLKENKITIEKKEKNGLFSKEETIIHLDPNVEFNNSFEKELFDMLYQASKDGLLQSKEFEKWCKNHYSRVLKWFTSVLDSVASTLIAEGKLVEIEKRVMLFKHKEYTLTPELREEAKQLKGLKKFLIEFTNIKTREAIEVHLFDEYLMFASIFGIADKVAKQFKDLYPDVIQNYDFDYDDIIFIHSFSYNGVHAASLAQSRAQSYSSGGGGFSSSGGGGGSFGGGGGGGGFR